MEAARPWLRAAAAMLALAAPGSAGASGQPAAQAPTAQAPDRVRWEVNWGEQYCTLVRERMGTDAVTFGIRIVPGSQLLDVIMVSRSWREFPVADQGSATIRLMPSGRTFESEPTATALRPNGNRAIILRSLTRDLIDALRDAGRLRIEREGRATLDLEIPSGGTAAAALQQCMDDVLRQWDVDPVALASLREPPRSRTRPASDWFRPDDYPAGAAERGTSGTVVTRLRVDAAGRIEDCDVVGRSGDESLDAATCRIVLRRGRFDSPAIGPDGQPVATRIIFVVSWYVTSF